MNPAWETTSGVPACHVAPAWLLSGIALLRGYGPIYGPIYDARPLPVVHGRLEGASLGAGRGDDTPAAELPEQQAALGELAAEIRRVRGS